MTERISSNGYTILKTMSGGRRLRFDDAVAFNQVMFQALIRRGYILLRLTDETFGLTNSGDSVLEAYQSTDPNSLHVKDDSVVRQQRVGEKLQASAPRRRRAANAA